MLCDIKNVIDTLIRNFGESDATHYNSVMNSLFAAFLRDTKKYSFDDTIISKMLSGINRVTPEMSGFYLNADRRILCGDIRVLIQYIFDKPNLQKELYELIQYDDTLSVPMRKNVLSRVSSQYRDDEALVNIIYEAVYIAVTRKYENDGNGYVAMKYTSDITPVGDALFSNSEYVAPCKHFCGRDAELDELHSTMMIFIFIMTATNSMSDSVLQNILRSCFPMRKGYAVIMMPNRKRCISPMPHPLK